MKTAHELLGIPEMRTRTVRTKWAIVATLAGMVALVALAGAGKSWSIARQERQFQREYDEQTRAFEREDAGIVVPAPFKCHVSPYPAVEIDFRLPTAEHHLDLTTARSGISYMRSGFQFDLKVGPNRRVRSLHVGLPFEDREVLAEYFSSNFPVSQGSEDRSSPEMGAYDVAYRATTRDGHYSALYEVVGRGSVWLMAHLVVQRND